MLARQSRLSEFVRRGQESASVEILLSGGDGQPDTRIKHILHSDREAENELWQPHCICCHFRFCQVLEFRKQQFFVYAQAVGHIPFRVMDEINHGMDEENERRVMDIIASKVESSSMPQRLS